MKNTTKLVGLSGSLRKDSYNTALLRAAAELLPEGTTLAVRTPHGIPLYNADLETADGIPATVADLKEEIANASGLLIATPEYNNSIPGVLKNTIDWLSRPPQDISRVFRRKPVAVLGASPGGFGTVLAQAALLPILRTLGTRPWFEGRLLVSRARDVFDTSGRLQDEEIRSRLEKFVSGFAAFTRVIPTQPD
jgi:chromate reductase, NAD(P)H dehydrogenase (quinone)